MAAEIEGIYVPAFYDVTYKEDGTIESFRPNNPHAKKNQKAGGYGHDRCNVSGETGRAVYQGNTG